MEKYLGNIGRLSKVHMRLNFEILAQSIRITRPTSINKKQHKKNATNLGRSAT
jgi:hypothetical protein